MPTRREAWALGACATILAITALWWALALWPLPGDAPDWVVRTREVCFGSVRNGLPTTAGWMVLLGQPLYMLVTLWLIAGGALVSGLRALAGRPAGRATIATALMLAVLGLGAAGLRVGRAETLADFATGAARPGAPRDIARLDRIAPPLQLVDQDGAPFTLARLRGRPALVTFAFAHCETVCPLIVRDVLAAQARAADLDPPPAVVVITLDPWRDAPARLTAIAAQWHLGSNAYVLSGTGADVEQVLDGWEVGRARDPRTGDVTHAAVVYVIDRAGRIAFSLSGADGETYAELLRRL